MKAEQASDEAYFMTIGQVAAFAGVSPRTIRRWEKTGLFPKRVRLSDGIVRWRKTDVRSWADNCSEAL